MLEPPPTVMLNVSPDRDYAFTLQQTKIVYDQLLADKHDKLMDKLYQSKAGFDAQCAKLEPENKDKALEYGVKAQDALNRKQLEAEQELQALHTDYQTKLNNMYHIMEEKWQEQWKKK